MAEENPSGRDTVAVIDSPFQLDPRLYSATNIPSPETRFNEANGWPTAGYLHNVNTQFSYIEWEIVVVPGTYHFAFLVMKVFDAGIVECTVDGVSAGTFDMYRANGSGTEFAVAEFTRAVPALGNGSKEPRKIAVRLTVSTKNASATGYYLYLLGGQVTRTI